MRALFLLFCGIFLTQLFPAYAQATDTIVVTGSKQQPVLARGAEKAYAKADTAFNKQRYKTALRHAKEACEGNHVSGCEMQLVLVGSDNFELRDYETARSLLTKLCDFGQIGFCGAIGMAYIKGWMDYPVDATLAQPYLEAGCDEGYGTPDVCVEYAFGILEDSEARLSRSESVMSALENACEEQPLSAQTYGACWLHGSLLSIGFGEDEPDLEWAREVLSPLCPETIFDDGKAHDLTALSCYRLALTSFEKTVRYADTQAIKRLEIACELDYGTACATIANTVSIKRNTLRTDDIEFIQGGEAVAIPAAKKGCELDEALACYWHGQFLHKAHLKAPDNLGAARTAYMTACDRGNLPACAELLIMLRLGQGGEKDPEAAGAVVAKLCPELNANTDECLWQVRRHITDDVDLVASRRILIDDMAVPECLTGDPIACTIVEQSTRADWYHSSETEKQADRKREGYIRRDVLPKACLNVDRGYYFCRSYFAISEADVEGIDDIENTDLRALMTDVLSKAVDLSQHLTSHCKAGDILACEEVWSIKNLDDRADTDEAQALLSYMLEAYSAACEKGNHLACFRQIDPFVKRDLVQVRALETKTRRSTLSNACNLNVLGACGQLVKDLTEQAPKDPYNADLLKADLCKDFGVFCR